MWIKQILPVPNNNKAKGDFDANFSPLGLSFPPPCLNTQRQ